MANHEDIIFFLQCKTTCDAKSLHISHLKASVHEGKKLFQCNICDATFAAKNGSQSNTCIAHFVTSKQILLLKERVNKKDSFNTLFLIDVFYVLFV